MRNSEWTKVGIIAGTTALTVAIHYGLILEPLFGHSVWVHAIHSRLCYIPIVMAASWYGLLGGLVSATAISLLIQPYIFLLNSPHVDISSEVVEIVFYFALAFLSGGFADREKRNRKQQEATQLQLERSHKFSLIGQMAAGVAHEIKNPLASIKGAVEILGSGDAGDMERKEFQQIIVKEIKRIDTTVQEFLDFARPKEVQLKRIDLSEIVHSSIRQLENQVRQAGMEFDAHIANGLMTMADPEKIHQVIINLVLNAVQASQPGQNIMVNLAAKGSYAVITVQDHGEGLSAEDTERIFEPFFTTKVHGIGLGLAIVKSIIERHKGDIKVEGTPGKGTSFMVLIPLAEARK